MNVISLSRHKAKLFLADLKSKVGENPFTVSFYKKNGEFRQLRGCFGISKGIKGTGLAYDPLEKGMFPVFDLDKVEYRMVTIDNIREVDTGDTVYKFRRW